LSLEGQLLDQKSLRAVTGKTAGWHNLVKGGVAFVNATSGRLLLGIEDDQHHPKRADQSKPILGDAVMRLTTKRSASPRETQIAIHIHRADIAPAKFNKLILALRASDRVK
jgi:hypothetical protein